MIMKKILLSLAVASTIFTACGDPSAEENYNNKATTTGADASQPEYNEQDDPAMKQLDSANRGKINNDPNGVNNPQK